MRFDPKMVRLATWALAVVGMSLITVAAWAIGPTVGVPERTRVCMVQDTVMTVPAVPVVVEGKTYYGCCEMCKGKLASEPQRYAVARDPLSGVAVDKATAELLSVDGRVLYFQSAANRDSFARQLYAGAKGSATRP